MFIFHILTIFISNLLKFWIYEPTFVFTTGISLEKYSITLLFCFTSNAVSMPMLIGYLHYGGVRGQGKQNCSWVKERRQRRFVHMVMCVEQRIFPFTTIEIINKYHNLLIKNHLKIFKCFFPETLSFVSFF